jgi:hypothetical protein
MGERAEAATSIGGDAAMRSVTVSPKEGNAVVQSWERWETMGNHGQPKAEMECAGKDAKSQDETLKIIQKTSLNLFDLSMIRSFAVQQL